MITQYTNRHVEKIMGGGRNSSFELLRIISMWMIVFYHFHLALAAEDSRLLFKAVQIPLHIAVLNFILISGYFSIHFSIKGICRFLSKIVFYAVAIFLIKFAWLFLDGHSDKFSLKECVNNLFCISRTDLWFIRSYFLLYMFSPFLNQMLSNQNQKQRFYFILCLAFFSVYIGIVGVDCSLIDGKNLVNFMLVYTLGYTIRQYNWGRKLSLKSTATLWILFVGILSLVYMLLGNTILGKVLWRFSFGYNSPLLIINSISFFLIFTKMRINSYVVNYLASSVFAVYLIHENSNVKGLYYDYIQSLNGECNLSCLYVALVVCATVVVTSCILADKIFLPIQDKISACMIRVVKSGRGKISKFIN